MTPAALVGTIEVTRRDGQHKGADESSCLARP
jgi:hypothetical protein